jgi:hypothetical protein
MENPGSDGASPYLSNRAHPRPRPCSHKHEREASNDWVIHQETKKRTREGALHPSGSANRRRVYERKTTVWNSDALRPRWGGLLSLVRGESADSYPGDPQNGGDQFARLLNSASLHAGAVA